MTDLKAAEDYLERMFGDSRGHVAVAYKDKGQSWQECQFAWPRDKRKLLGWARVHADANIFICPALRKDGHTRKKNDGQNLRWLWADVDFDKVPSGKVQTVHERIKKVGTYIVSSGTGDNAHVYVDLGEEVPIDEFTRLNTGLRDFLYGDNKQADNSLLRLPGMINWKTAEGRPVAVRGGHGKRVGVSSLMKVKAFREARVIRGVDDYDWEPADLSDVSARWKRLARMDVEEALSRYGSRHKAVWAVAGDLVKAGLNSDQVHTLMDTFPAALDKMDEENGYDLHKDVEKRLQYESDREVEGPDDNEPDEAIQELSEEEALEEEALKILRRRQADRLARRMEAERGFTPPPPDMSCDLSDALSRPPVPIPYLIGPPEDEEGLGLAGAKHNVIITAQYKTGKTTFMMGSLIQSLVDGTPFLEHFTVPKAGVVVGHWNCEMEHQELIDQYARPVGIEHPERVKLLSLRGHNLDILSEMGKEYAVNWLKSNGVKVWTIDSLARLARMAGVTEKDNDEMLNLLMRVDEIKEEAGVDVTFTIAHTGRMEHEEGKERARGATVIDDWPDSRWIMTKDGDVRFLAVEGRGVRLSTVALAFDGATGRSKMGIGDKADMRAQGGAQAALEIVTEQPGILKTALKKAIMKAVKCGPVLAEEHISEAVECLYIVQKRNPQRKSGSASYIYTLPERTSGGATPRRVNMRRA